MGNKFDFNTAMKLSKALSLIPQQLKENNLEIGKKYDDLGDSFKDREYFDYKEKFAECDKNIKKICETMEELSTSLSRYAEKLKNI